MLDISTITIDKTAYTLQFPLKALIRAEALLGKSLQSLFMPAKGEDGKPAFPDITFNELTILFKLALSHSYNMSDKAMEDLLETYLSEGQTVANQKYILYLSLGKAAGFFRIETDFQKEAMEKLSPKS